MSDEFDYKINEKTIDLLFDKEPRWGKQFKKSETVANGDWLFKITESYRFWECEAIPGRTGKLVLEVEEVPTETLAQKLFADDERKLAYVEVVRGDSYRLKMPMDDYIHQRFEFFKNLARSEKAIDFCNKTLEKTYESRIRDIQHYKEDA